MKIKIIIIICALLSLTNSYVFSQKINELDDIINTSFIKYIESTNTSSELSTIFIAMDNYPYGFVFNDEIQKYGFVHIFLNNENSRKNIKKRETIIYMLGPILEGNKMDIIFSERSIFKKKNKIYVSTGPFMVKCTWKYNPHTNKWEFMELEKDGL